MMPAQNGVENYSVAIIGSSGGGTATLGHTNTDKLITAIHRELLRIRHDNSADAVGSTTSTSKRTCAGISHAIFVSLCDGGGFDSIGVEDWKPDQDGTRGTKATLFTLGFKGNQASIDHFQINRMATGPLSKINAQVKKLDDELAASIENSSIRAIISISSEPYLFHKTLTAAAAKELPIVGSGGTSLGVLASNYDLKIIGNSGGSVASTTLTKARGWAMGLAEEWGMKYVADYNSNAKIQKCVDEANDSNRNVLPSLRSILESALPSFLFVCMTLRFMSQQFSQSETQEGVCTYSSMQQEPVRVLEYALKHIVLGTTCCVLAATSRSKDSSVNGDQSVILLAATLAGVITSASVSLVPSVQSCGGGSALAGLVAGACIPSFISAVLNLCVRFQITATMTNCLLAGGVGIATGLWMYLSGISYALSALTAVVRCTLQWRKLSVVNDDAPWLLRNALTTIKSIQQNWIDAATSPNYSYFCHHKPSTLIGTSEDFIPTPKGLGFVIGCIFVYGSKVGWCHSIFLPLILIEMDGTSDPSLLGAMDECVLVMVCAGICAGNLLVPPPAKSGGTGHRSLSWQALKTNISCGDFIEAAYPYMNKSRLINASAYLAAGISSEILMQRRVFGSAYLPLPIAIWLSNDTVGMSIALVTAFGVCFIDTLLQNSLL